jgi:uncharacterized protein YbjT (DUF2867 family)
MIRYSGGSVVDALLKHGIFTPHAISRDPQFEASKKLAARGVQVVKGDALDKMALVGALRGSEAVFAVRFTQIATLSLPFLPLLFFIV